MCLTTVKTERKFPMHKAQIECETDAGTGEKDELKVALNGTFAIASVGIATLEMLETLLPAAAKEVEHESREISKNFLCITDYLNQKKDTLPKEVQDAMAGIVVGLQF